MGLTGTALLGLALAVASEPELPERVRERLDPRAVQVMARSYVPEAEKPVGEVRLIRRGDANVVQTLLYTKVLSRVVAEIRKKELANWPDDPGRSEALRYVEALAAAQKRIFGELAPKPFGGDRRQKLWIEFLVAPGAALVAIGRFELETGGGEVRVSSRELLAVLEPARDYVARNMRLIAADSFRVEGPQLEALLAPLEWLRAPH